MEGQQELTELTTLSCVQVDRSRQKIWEERRCAQREMSVVTIRTAREVFQSFLLMKKWCFPY